jgi:hypothetical protein
MADQDGVESAPLAGVSSLRSRFEGLSHKDAGAPAPHPGSRGPSPIPPRTSRIVSSSSDHGQSYDNSEVTITEDIFATPDRSTGNGHARSLSQSSFLSPESGRRKPPPPPPSRGLKPASPSPSPRITPATPPTSVPLISLNGPTTPEKKPAPRPPPRRQIELHSETPFDDPMEIVPASAPATSPIHVPPPLPRRELETLSEKPFVTPRRHASSDRESSPGISPKPSIEALVARKPPPPPSPKPSKTIDAAGGVASVANVRSKLGSVLPKFV